MNRASRARQERKEVTFEIAVSRRVAAVERSRGGIGFLIFLRLGRENGAVFVSSEFTRENVVF